MAINRVFGKCQNWVQVRTCEQRTGHDKLGKGSLGKDRACQVRTV